MRLAQTAVASRARGEPARPYEREEAARIIASRLQAYNRRGCGTSKELFRSLLAEGLMSKAFTREQDFELDDELEGGPPLPAGSRNYMTPRGFARLKAELARLVEIERPEVVATVAWAAGNGDRSENGDYIYGKKRLREIDRRIRFLVARLDKAEVVDPLARRDADNADQIFFGATVTVIDSRGKECTVSIVGIDEIDTVRGYISWMSPMARALIKSRAGDSVTLRTPGGAESIEIVDVRYEALETG
jgi:transcription elongation factor GreB